MTLRSVDRAAAALPAEYTLPGVSLMAVFLLRRTPSAAEPPQSDQLRHKTIDRGKLVFNGTPRELQEKAPYGHRLRLTVCASDDAPVRAMLEKLPQVRKAELLGKQEKTVSLAVYPAGSEKDFVSAVKKALDEHKWEFCELYLEHGRLDEVFRSLTTSDAVEGKEGAA